MLASSFIHLTGIGAQTERTLWKRGIRSWPQLIERLEKTSIGSAPRRVVRAELEESDIALRERRHQFFARRLRRRDIWRALEDFGDSCVYLDIETDGSNNEDSVTMIGLYDGKDFQCLVKGDNLESFRDIITRYSMIVTFFGTGFDIPVLAKRFPDVIFDHIHVDLCHSLQDLGYRGGLKKIEKTFGIERSPETEGLTGYDAVHLWRKYLRGSDLALERLTAYNREDVVNLAILAEKAYTQHRKRVGFDGQLALELS